jgi:FkbM family methyltransferase
METYKTNYGLITLYKNEVYIGKTFANGDYWDIDTLLKLRKYIQPNRNILEIGGHCGTSTIIYASFLNDENKVHVYEPQNNMYNLLLKNIQQNHLQNKIIAYHSGVFCYNGNGKMNCVDLDGGGGEIEKRYNEEQHLGCNFGGVGLGKNGEMITLTTLDSMKYIDNIGFIHCDAQGAENFIFSKGLELIKKNRPVILYENNKIYAKYLYDNVFNSYPEFKEESIFDIKKYCMEELNYHSYIDCFNGSIDTLLIPNDINENYDKTIYITYKNIDKLEKIKKQWLDLNPGYTVELFDDERCLKFLNETFGKKYCDIFNYIKDGPIKCDFFRTCLIYICGGVYVDADVNPLIPLQEFIKDDVDFVTCLSYNYDKNNNYFNYNPQFIIAKKYNEYLYKTIKTYEKYYDEQRPYNYWKWSICKLFDIPIDCELTRENTDIIINEQKYQFLIETVIHENNDYDFTNIKNEKGERIINKIYNCVCKYKNKTVISNFDNKNLL